MMSSKAPLKLTMSRTFDAPRSLVWKAWTERERLKLWTPNGLVVAFSEMDLREGGAWRTGLQAADGTMHIEYGIYREIAPLGRLVFTHAWESKSGGPGHETLVTIVLQEHDGRTTMTFTQEGFKSTESRDGHEGGWGEAFAHLTSHVQEPARQCEPARRTFVMTREFDAPRDLVWRAWTEPAQLERWWGPTGFAISHCTVDLRVGGCWRCCLTSPEGIELWGRYDYREIVEPERLVFEVAFSDKNGDLVRHPFNEKWPMRVLSTVDFEERDARTVITVTWIPLEPTDAEETTFETGRPDMHAGWTGTFDRFVDFLAP